jgi:hypothetical protein
VNALGIDIVHFAAGHSYQATFQRIADSTLTVDGSDLGSGDTLLARFLSFGAVGVPWSYSATGGDGDDFVLVGGYATVGLDLNFAGFDGDDFVDGGAGNDTLEVYYDFSGGQALTLADDQLASIETIAFQSGYDRTWTMADGNTAAGATVTVDASNMDAGNTLIVDASAETDGHYAFIGHGFIDIFTGGALADTFTSGDGTETFAGGGGADAITCGTGVDTLVYASGADSTSVNYDTVSGIDLGADKFDLHVAITGYNGVVNAVVDSSDFDGTMGNACVDHLTGHHAIVVHGAAGDLIGHDYLVADVDGDAQYDPGADYVIEITGFTGTLDVGDFI